MKKSTFFWTIFAWIFSLTTLVLEFVYPEKLGHWTILAGVLSTIILLVAMALTTRFHLFSEIKKSFKNSFQFFLVILFIVKTLFTIFIKKVKSGRNFGFEKARIPK